MAADSTPLDSCEWLAVKLGRKIPSVGNISVPAIAHGAGDAVAFPFVVHNSSGAKHKNHRAGQRMPTRWLLLRGRYQHPCL